MQLRKDIPSYINYEGEKLNVSYFGQPQTCTYCNDPTQKVIDRPSKRQRRWQTVINMPITTNPSEP